MRAAKIAALVAAILVIGSYLAGPGPQGFWHTAKGAYYSFLYPDYDPGEGTDPRY
jgi:hypothetical protein